MGKRLDFNEIICNYLTDNGFDGLHNGGECGCLKDDLAPCGEFKHNCLPGYKVVAPANKGNHDFDFYVCPNENEEPWKI